MDSINRIPNEYLLEKRKSSFSSLEDNQQSIAKFLKIMSKGIDKHGVKKITSILSSMDVSSEFENNGTSDLVDFICSEVISNYNNNRENKISTAELFKKEKRGDVTLARKMLMILLSQFVGMTPTRLGEFLGRSRQVVHTTMCEFKDLDPKHKQDLDFLNRHYAISNNVIAYIEKNKIDVKK